MAETATSPGQHRLAILLLFNFLVLCFNVGTRLVPLPALRECSCGDLSSRAQLPFMSQENSDVHHGRHGQRGASTVQSKLPLGHRSTEPFGSDSTLIPSMVQSDPKLVLRVTPTGTETRGPLSGGSMRRLMQVPKHESANNAFSTNPTEKEELVQLKAQTAMMSKRVVDLQHAFQKAVEERSALELKLKLRSRHCDCGNSTQGSLKDAIAATDAGGESKGMFMVGNDGKVKSWKGYQCAASEEEIELYLSYTANELCPDDWFFVQYLIYMKGCYALPKRNCFARTPQNPVKPLPFPAALFDQNALADENVRWGQHWCKSFSCLNNRTDGGDCLNCFNMRLEGNRWKPLSSHHGAPPMDDVLARTNIPLRLGLDAGGGTGSFAAHLALRNITVITTSFNIETLPGRDTHGLPYMETIALRGLVPLHVPHQARLPFYDGTFDFVHCMNSVKYLKLSEFELLLFDWDRILRPGGVLWFELFYASEPMMKQYIATLERIGYRKLYWNTTPKPQEAIVWHEPLVYLNCVLEKPVRKDPPPNAQGLQ